MKEIILRFNLYLLALILLTVVLFFGKVVLVPVVFAIFFAMLMAPVCRWLDKKGLHRALSCAVCILILLSALLVTLAVTAAEVSVFAKDLPKVEEKATELIGQVQSYIGDKVGMSNEEQTAFVKKQVQGAGKSAGKYIGAFLGGMVTTIASLLLTLAFTFLFLFNKEMYESFFLKLYKDEDPAKVKRVVGKICHVAQQYLTGRVMSILILTALYTVGLLIVGIKSAILLAAIAALLTVVPYVGSTLGGVFPFMMALVTEDSIDPALWVIAVIVFIQTVDNYFIEPNVVGGEVNLSALASILIILCGGILWGVAGMILFIPMLAIVKIVCDNVEPLKPFGYVLADPSSRSKPSKFKQWATNALKFGKGK
jgi:predicted PurR-regulated permease PerM